MNPPKHTRATRQAGPPPGFLQNIKTYSRDRRSPLAPRHRSHGAGVRAPYAGARTWSRHPLGRRVLRLTRVQLRSEICPEPVSCATGQSAARGPQDNRRKPRGTVRPSGPRLRPHPHVPDCASPKPGSGHGRTEIVIVTVSFSQCNANIPIPPHGVPLPLSCNELRLSTSVVCSRRAGCDRPHATGF